MTMIIEVTSRDWDVENVTNALALPAKRHYVGHLTVDNTDAQTTWEGDVQVLDLHDEELTVQEWDEDASEAHGPTWTVPVADIRRVEFY